MDIGFTVFKGFLQGLTEFLPVSSTAHLTFVNAIFRMFGWHTTPPRPGEEEFFDILLHIGTLMAVVYYFRGELAQFARMCIGRESNTARDRDTGILFRDMPWFLAISMVVTVVFILGMLKGTGLLFEQMGWTTPVIENLSDYYFQHPQFVAFHLIVTGCLLFFTEKYSAHPNRQSRRQPFAMKNALAIGLLQGCAAIFHGISRSGSTISAGLATGLDRMTATRYSFMLSIPTFLMAAVYEAQKVYKLGYIADLNWPAMLVGTAVSAVVGYFCVKYFIKYVASHSLVGFAIYCWAMGALMFVLFSLQGAPQPAA